MSVDLFSIGSSSLHTAKKSLSTTSHNISNANTEGFSRQRVTTETSNPVGEGDYVLGNGVQIREIKRVHDDLVEKKLNNSISNSSYHNERSSQLGRVEEIFNEVNNEGMNKVLNRFFNSFRELSNRPDDEVVRTMVRDNANMVVSDFKRINQEITQSKEAIDRKITSNIEVVNDHAKKIAQLNVEIVRLENSVGAETGDLRDRRDTSIRELAKQFQIHAYEDGKGHFNVNIVGGGTLVTGGTTSELEARKTPAYDSKTRRDEGNVEVYFKGRNSTPLSNYLKNGETKALIQTRNVEIDNLREQMDKLAYNLVKSTNAIHQKGFSHKEVFFDEAGSPINNPSNPVTGLNFFKDASTVDSASEFLELSDEVQEDLRNISSGLNPNAPGDNRVAIAISKLQHEKIIGERGLTFEESYLEAVGTIGLKTAKSKIDSEQADGIMAQAQSIKQRTSGVSLDEESANLVRYQHQYDASARVIKVADEMFDSVLGMMR